MPSNSRLRPAPASRASATGHQEGFMKRSLVRCLASSCVAIALSDSVSAREVDPVTGAVAASEATEVGWHMAGLAVPFEANTGQTDERGMSQSAASSRLRQDPTAISLRPLRERMS